MLLRGKCVELEQMGEAWRGSQRVQRECEDRHKCSMRKRDTLISQLQTTLRTRIKEAEVSAGLLPVSVKHVILNMVLKINSYRSNRLLGVLFFFSGRS